MTSMDQAVLNEKLWAAVSTICDPSTKRLNRDPDAEYIIELKDTGHLACRVDKHKAATSGHGTVPSLWEQAEQALFGGEQQIGRGSKPLRERSIADMDLMETMADIRESVSMNLDGRKVHPKDRRPTVPGQLRQLASFVVTNEPDHVELLGQKVAAWGRQLATYLRVLDHKERDVYVRNTPCPECGIRQVAEMRDGEKLVNPAIIIEFGDGYVRAARCRQCNFVWWRGPDLEWLADVTNPIRIDQQEAS